jgi:hypothetical protein
MFVVHIDGLDEGVVFVAETVVEEHALEIDEHVDQAVIFAMRMDVDVDSGHDIGDGPDHLDHALGGYWRVGYHARAVLLENADDFVRMCHFFIDDGG